MRLMAKMHKAQTQKLFKKFCLYIIKKDTQRVDLGVYPRNGVFGMP